MDAAYAPPCAGSKYHDALMSSRIYPSFVSDYGIFTLAGNGAS
jgi:hypothetical protein